VPGPLGPRWEDLATARKATSLWTLIKCSVEHWVADNASTLGAALAFYCAFSLAPLLVLTVTAAGLFVGSDVAYSYVGQQLTGLFGAGTARVLIEATRSAQSADGIVATVVSIITLVIGASTVFTALENALELIWGAQENVPKGVRGFLRSRLLSFGFILALGFLLLVSLTISTGVAALRTALAHRVAGLVVLTAGLDFVISVAFITGLFFLLYRYMPARRAPAKPVLWGALVTALLFQLGRWAIGLYLGKSTQPSAFGAAASFVALLLWLYYSAQIFLLGAEFTSCLAGLRPVPEKIPRHEGTPRTS
jgi:membrane protein